MLALIKLSAVGDAIWLGLGWAYYGLVGIYFLLASAIVINVVRQLVYRGIQKIKEQDYNIDVNERRYGLHVVGNICLVVFLLWFVAITDLSLSTQWWMLTVIISSVSYFSGWRSANLGVIVGALGTLLGLMVFSWASEAIVWSEHTAAFFLLNILGNASGWFGAFVGRGQIREAQCISEFRIHIKDDEKPIKPFFEKLAGCVEGSFNKNWDGRQVVMDFGKSQVRIAEGKVSKKVGSYFVKFSEGRRWGHKYAPMAKGFQWAFGSSWKVRSFNEICSHVFNVWRYAFCSLELRTSVDEGPGEFSILLKNYWEIPALVYIDHRVRKVADDTHEDLYKMLKNMGPEIVDIKSHELWILSNWEAKPNLEQIAIVTPGGIGNREEVAVCQNLMCAGIPPLRIIEEFEGANTFFDQFRGRASSIILFIGSQVVLGLAMSYLSKISCG